MGLMKATVIVIRRTTVFVIRDRAQGQPAYDNSAAPAITPHYKVSGILPIWPDLTREFLKDKGEGIKDKNDG